MNNQIKYAFFALINFVFFLNGFSQTTATAPANSASDFNISINATLAIIAVVLLFIIIVLSITVNQAIDFYKSKKKSDSTIKPLAILIGFLALSQIAFSQTATVAAPVVADHSAQQLTSIYFYSFIVVIIVEVAIILFLLKSIRFLTGIEQQQKLQTAKSGNSIWNKINEFKPLEEEASLDTGHSYDGIRELDNVTPPWFKAAFAATIVFAIIYLYRYEVAHSAPNQVEEFETEMREAKIIQDSLLKLEGNKIDENSVVLLTNSGEIAEGKSLFMANCIACHGDKGQGGVGPNLTDEYWIHSGSVKDVFKSIKYGWVEKGMKSWKDDFSPKQIAELSSYIETLKGTNPPNAKEKQGELYVEATAATTTIVADSTAK
jgi:cytochrome c oxidase cbb3-type subunit 3